MVKKTHSVYDGEEVLGGGKGPPAPACGTTKHTATEGPQIKSIPTCFARKGRITSPLTIAVLG